MAEPINPAGTGKTSTGKTSTGKTSTGKTRTGKTRTGKTRTGKTRTGKTRTGETLTGKLCAICDKPAIQAFKPFCSSRCADIDLGRWLKGSYVIPGKPLEEAEGAPGSGDPDEE